jgi:hypothetical protein
MWMKNNVFPGARSSSSEKIECFFYGHVPNRVFQRKKNSTREGKTAPGIVLKKKTFLRRSRKPPNLCLTIHSGTAAPVRPGWPMLWRGADEGIFFQRADKLRLLRLTNPPRGGSNSGRQGAKRTARPTGLAFTCQIGFSKEKVLIKRKIISPSDFST